MGCRCIRVSGLAVANTLCFGATAAVLTYTLVRVAVDAHTKAAAAAIVVTTFLLIWFCAGCTAYLAFCRRTLHRVPAGRRPKDLLSTSAGGMDLLAREPPERGWARVAPADDVVVAYYEQPAEAAGARPAVECAVCKEEVRPAQVVGRPPACLRAFHKHCIDSWLRDHSTCPVCRHNVHAPLRLAQMV